MFDVLGKFNCKIHKFILINIVTALKGSQFYFLFKTYSSCIFVKARKMCSHIASNVRLGLNIQVYLICYCTIRVKLRN